ncbi:MAG: O-antigen ligase family protein, partial [Bacteroidales bacterium]|nr:O-antigen ligase family protein [Bacteroidales bacterium]
WAGHGFFGHLFTLLMGLNIFWMFAADKNHKRYWLYVFGFLGVALLFLVKCWFLIPLAGGLLLRLLTGKTKFGIKIVFLSVFTGLAFFFATYWMLLYVAAADKDIPESRIQQPTYKAEISTFIAYHALAYVTAGVYGLSEDLAQNTLECRNPEVIYAPMINLCRVAGDKNYVSNINDQYIRITSNYGDRSNVRSFFGSLYVYLGTWHAAAYALVFSALIYSLFALAWKRRHTFALIIVGWIMGCLLMGWFDLYSTSLNFISIPGFLAVIFGLCFLWEHRKNLCLGKLHLYVRMARRLLALLQTISLALAVAFFWTPWHLPSYFLGVSVGIAFAFVLTVPRRALAFRFLRPYLAFLLLYLLTWVSVVYASYPELAVRYTLQQTPILLFPFIFWGMTPRFFSRKRIRLFAFCFVIGCVLFVVVKITQLVYCFSIFEPYFKARYVNVGLLYSVNEFLSNQGIYFGWAYLHPIMNTTLEALIFNLAFSLTFIALVQKHPWLNSRLKKCVAVFILLLFSLILITSNSKTGQFMFVVTLITMLVFSFRKKRWSIAYSLSALLLLSGIGGIHYLEKGISGRFTNSIRVLNEMENHEQKITNDGSLLPRLYAWNTALEMAKEKPVFGFGASFRKDFVARCTPEHYPNLRKAYHHPHNQFLSVLVSNGAVGLCVFFLFWVQAVHLVWKNRRLWGWIWLLSLFAFCCIEVFLKNISFTYVCLPYCFLMVEYHNRKKIPEPAESLAPKP